MNFFCSSKWLCVVLFFSMVFCYAQQSAWQQSVNYKMSVALDDKKHQYKGTQRLVYVNNSPDTLYRVFYHLYFNAFRPNSAMDVHSRKGVPDPDPRVGDRIHKLCLLYTSDAADE